MLKVKRTKKMGRGIFAARDIKRGEVVEISPVLIIPDDEIVLENLLSLYVFGWRRGKLALALGFGSLINHSLKPNLSYSMLRGPGIPKIVFKAKRNIRKGQQLFINYGYPPVSAYKNYKRAKKNASR